MTSEASQHFSISSISPEIIPFHQDHY